MRSGTASPGRGSLGRILGTENLLGLCRTPAGFTVVKA